MEDEDNEVWLVDVVFKNGDGATYYTTEQGFDDEFCDWVDGRGVKKLTIEIFESVGV